MNKKMIYLCNSRFEKLNSYEIEHHKISYKTLLDYYDITPILCNNILEVDPYLFENLESGQLYDKENDCYVDIYQYFIIDVSQWELDDIKQKLKEDEE